MLINYALPKNKIVCCVTSGSRNSSLLLTTSAMYSRGTYGKIKRAGWKEASDANRKVEESLVFCRFKPPVNSPVREGPSYRKKSMSSSVVKDFIPILTLCMQVYFSPLLSLQSTEDISFTIAYSSKRWRNTPPQFSGNLLRFQKDYTIFEAE